MVTIIQNINVIDESGNSGYKLLYCERPSVNGPSGGCDYTLGVRVIVQLKNNIVTTGKNEKGEWKLVIK